MFSFLFASQLHSVAHMVVYNLNDEHLSQGGQENAFLSQTALFSTVNYQ